MRRGVLIGGALLVVSAGLASYVLRREADCGRANVVGEVALAEVSGSGPRESRGPASIRFVTSETGSQVISTSPFNPAEKSTASEGWRVRVVKAGTGAPVPGIEVAQIPMEDVLSGARLQADGGYVKEMEWLMERSGCAVRTDESGQVVFSGRMKTAVIVARNAKYFGLAFVQSSERGLATVEVVPLGGGAIQTIGTDGIPRRGVPVAVVVNGSGTQFVVWRGTTRDPGGLARVTDVPLQPFFAGSSALPYDLEVILDTPLESRPSVPLKGNRFPVEPVRLRIPDTGRVEVIVHAPTERDLIARLFSGAALPNMSVGTLTPGSPAVLVKNGRALFEAVGLGLVLQVHVSDPAGRLAAVTQSIAGPCVPGETIAVDVSLERQRPAMRGRVIDIQGRPLANRRLMMSMPILASTKSYNRSSVVVETDADGCFEVQFDDEAIARVCSQDLVEGLVRDRDASTSLTEGRVTLNGSRPPGDIDLGQIVLREVPVAVTGVVVDDQQKPIPNLRIMATMREASSRLPGSRRVWTDGAGRFTIRWSEDAGDLELSFGKKGYWAPEVSGQRSSRRSSEAQVFLPIGTRDVVLRLHRAAAIVGSLCLDPATSVEEVRVVVGSPRGARRGAAWSEGVTPSPAWTFELEGLVPAEAEVRIIDVLKSQVLLTIPDISLRSGVTCRDPRLQEIDLRGLIKNEYEEYLVKVKDSEGSLLEGVWVRPQRRVVQGPGSPGERMVTDSGGCLEIVTVGPTLRVQLEKQGFVSASEELRPGTNEITLERPYLVRVRISFKPAPPRDRLTVFPVPDGERIALWSLLRAGRDTLIRGKGSWTSDNELSIEFSAPRPGRYELDLRLLWAPAQRRAPGPEPRRRPRVALDDSVEICPGKTVDIEPGEHLTEVEIAMPPQLLQKALDAAR